MVNNDENDKFKKLKSVALNQVNNINNITDDNSSNYEYFDINQDLYYIKKDLEDINQDLVGINQDLDDIEQGLKGFNKSFEQIDKKFEQIDKDIAKINEKLNKRTFDIWTLMISIILALTAGIALTVFTNTFRYIEKIEDNRMNIIHIQKQIGTNAQQKPIDNTTTNQKQKNTKIQKYNKLDNYIEISKKVAETALYVFITFMIFALIVISFTQIIKIDLTLTITPFTLIMIIALLIIIIFALIS